MGGVHVPSESHRSLPTKPREDDVTQRVAVLEGKEEETAVFCVLLLYLC